MVHTLTAMPHTTSLFTLFPAGKMMVLDRMLPKLEAKGHRVLLFSQFTTFLDVIEDYLIMRGYKYRWGTHSTSVAAPIGHLESEMLA